jgi:hypothetical protein
MNNYPNGQPPERTQETALEYQSGYQQYPYPQYQPQPPQQVPMPYPQPGYPQQQMAPGYPAQQQPMQYPQYIQYPQPGYAPYPQQMMMPPQPVNVVVNNANNNVNAAMGGFGYVQVRRRRTPILLSLIYLFFIGYWLGPSWLVIALILTALGQESGQTMMRQLPMAFFLQQPS